MSAAYPQEEQIVFCQNCTGPWVRLEAWKILFRLPLSHYHVPQCTQVTGPKVK